MRRYGCDSAALLSVIGGHQQQAPAAAPCYQKCANLLLQTPLHFNINPVAAY
jgi:hypothetical protein